MNLLRNLLILGLVVILGIKMWTRIYTQTYIENYDDQTPSGLPKLENAQETSKESITKYAKVL